MGWFGPVDNCGCCGSGCNIVTLRDGTDWTGWTNPPPDTGDGSGFGDVPSGTTTSIIHPRTSCNWTVDIQLDHQVPMEGAKIVVGYPTSTTFLSAEWVVSDTADAKIQLSLEGVFQDAYYLTMNVAYWLRFIEGNDLDGDRHYTVEVWDTDPNVAGSNIVHTSCYYLPAEACDAARQEVEIEIAASVSADFPIGTVRAGDTFYDNSACPDPTCGDCIHSYRGDIAITATVVDGPGDGGCNCVGESVSWVQSYNPASRQWGTETFPGSPVAVSDICGVTNGDSKAEVLLQCNPSTGFPWYGAMVELSCNGGDWGYGTNDFANFEVVSLSPLHLRKLVHYMEDSLALASATYCGAVFGDPDYGFNMYVDIVITEAP